MPRTNATAKPILMVRRGSCVRYYLAGDLKHATLLTWRTTDLNQKIATITLYHDGRKETLDVWWDEIKACRRHAA